MLMPLSNPPERGGDRRSSAEGNEEVEFGGLSPSPGKCLYFWYQNGEFYAFSEIFIHTVTALTTCFEHIFFSKKGTLIKRVGVWTPWTPIGTATAKANAPTLHPLVMPLNTEYEKLQC